MEVQNLQKTTVETFARHVRFSVKILLLCNKTTKDVDVDKFFITLLNDNRNMVEYVGTLNGFLDDYKRIHTLESLPAPLVTELPTDTREGPVILASPAVLQELPKIWKIIDDVFLQPWKIYNNVVERQQLKIELKKLSEEFFKVKATDDANMEVENEAPVDPKILNSLIEEKVAAATKKLTNKVNRLKKQASKESRDSAGAGKKKKAEKEAGRKDRDTSKGSPKSETKQPSKKSTKSSTKNTTRTRRRSQRSKRQTTKN